MLALRAKLRDGIKPVEGTGSALEAAADAAAAAERPDRCRPRGRTRRAACAAERGADRSSPRLQGETPLILPTVDYQAVAAVVGDWTGIPVGRMARNEMETVLKLADSCWRSA